MNHDGMVSTAASSSGSLCVAHACQTYYKLSENWIRHQVEYVPRYAPVVLSYGTENVETQPKGVSLFEQSALRRRFDTAWNRLFGYYPSFYSALRRNKADVLHAHFGPMGYHMLPLAKKAGIPLITTFYGYDLSYLPSEEPEWRQKYQRLFEEGDAFLLEGAHMRDRLVSLWCPPEKAFVQRLGVEVDDWEFRPRFKSEDEPLKLLFAGRFTEKKGLPYALDGFAEALDAGVDARLTVVGDADGSPRSQRVKKYVLDRIETPSLDDRIDLRGFIPRSELVEAYYNHHALVAPSVEAEDGDTEGGAPVTLIEAQATGLPVVSTYHCDIPEVVVDGETGLLAPERDAEAVADHLVTLASDPGLLADLGRSGRDHVHEEYSAHVQGRRLADRYDAVLSKTSGSR